MERRPSPSRRASTGHDLRAGPTASGGRTGDLAAGARVASNRTPFKINLTNPSRSLGGWAIVLRMRSILRLVFAEPAQRIRNFFRSVFGFNRPQL